jgi:hypothetical protein
MTPQNLPGHRDLLNAAALAGLHEFPAETLNRMTDVDAFVETAHLADPIWNHIRLILSWIETIRKCIERRNFRTGRPMGPVQMDTADTKGLGVVGCNPGSVCVPQTHVDGIDLLPNFDRRFDR